MTFVQYTYFSRADQDHRELLVCVVPLDLRDSKATVDHLALRVPSGKLDCLDLPDPRAPRVSRAVPACTDLPAHLAIEDRLEIYRKSSDPLDRLDRSEKVEHR